MALESRSASLEQAIEELSEAQREAVDWREGALVLLAVPGAGKTRVLTCRIGHLLESTPDENFRILALTFTNKAADEMRERVAGYVPGRDGRLFLGTFHGFCAEVLRTHGSHLGIRPDFKIYSAKEDLQAVLAEAVRRTPAIRKSVDLDKGLSYLNRLRADLIPPDEVGKVIHNPNDAGRVAAVYLAYEEVLKELNALDFNSLLCYAQQLMTRVTFAKHYRRVYRYWCIDEFQDTNRAQYLLLKTMAGESFRNLFVVADDDQVIYEWNGASYRRVDDFREDFQAHLIQLPTNYRCPNRVVELANRLISHNRRRTAGKAPLVADRVKEPEEVVRLLHFESDADELRGVIRDIRERQLSPGSVSVLARNRTLLERLPQQFSDEGLRAVLTQRRDDFISPHFRWLHSCLRLAVAPTDKRSLEALMGSFQRLTECELSPETVLTRAESSHGHLLRAWAESPECQNTHPSLAQAVLDNLSDGASHRKFIAFALAWFEQQPSNDDSDYQEDRKAWTELAGSLREKKLSNYLQELDLRSKAPIPGPESITLWTIHAAKGREFEHVYLIGLADEVLPSFQALRPGQESSLEEERRNCFVAITRTRRTLTLTYADSYRGWKKKPSRFLDEMGLLRHE